LVYGTFVVAFAPDGKTLVTGGRDGLVKRWDVATSQCLRTLEQHHWWVEALAVSTNGGVIASADGCIRLWDAATGADACPQPGHHSRVSQGTLSPEGKIAVTIGFDNSMRWWDVSARHELRKIDLPGFASGLGLSGKTMCRATPPLATGGCGKNRPGSTWAVSIGMATGAGYSSR
jgi:WD40 repeat protein